MNIREALKKLWSPEAHQPAPTLDYDESTAQGQQNPAAQHGTNTPPPPRKPWTPGT